MGDGGVDGVDDDHTSVEGVDEVDDDHIALAVNAAASALLAEDADVVTPRSETGATEHHMYNSCLIFIRVLWHAEHAFAA